jgi:hypothetical protein
MSILTYSSRQLYINSWKSNAISELKEIEKGKITYKSKANQLKSNHCITNTWRGNNITYNNLNSFKRQHHSKQSSLQINISLSLHAFLGFWGLWERLVLHVCCTVRWVKRCRAHSVTYFPNSSIWSVLMMELYALSMMTHIISSQK